MSRMQTNIYRIPLPRKMNSSPTARAVSQGVFVIADLLMATLRLSEVVLHVQTFTGPPKSSMFKGLDRF